MWKAFVGATMVAMFMGCAGARYDIAADHAKYPISFSPALPLADGTNVYLNHQLEPVGQFEFERTQLGWVWSLVASKPLEISDQINGEVAAKHGEGVVALSITNKSCVTNYLFPFPILPFWPGCQVVTVKGTVVRLKVAAATATPAQPPAVATGAVQ
jgi:hypothetical protein